MLILAIDANFRLRLKARGIKDPELGSGWAYFVEESEYVAHIKKNMEDKDVSPFFIPTMKSYIFVAADLWINIQGH